MPAPVVFFDIAGPNLQQQSAFYSKVFGWEIAADGRFTVTVASPLSATLRQDPADKVIYLGVEDVAATLAQVEANGGAVVAPRFEVPGVVILGLFTDPAGNSMGLVEVEGGQVKVP
jgi:predicted enzyme related to lactoylglutathione lyase